MNTGYQKQTLHTYILKYTSRITNYKQKHTEKKTDCQTFLNISYEDEFALNL